MEPNFWLQRWENNEIGFHASDTNPLLKNYFPALAVPEGSRVFVPLCGKTLDIAWLLTQNYRVAGAELSELAIEQLFQGLGIQPQITQVGTLKHYAAPQIDIFVGDIFDLSAEVLGPIDAIYDRAALVALPATLRSQYTAHLRTLTHNAPQLLVCYEYDQSLASGPPFSIVAEEVHQHYDGYYEVQNLLRAEVPGGFRGQFPAQESVWVLTRV